MQEIFFDAHTHAHFAAFKDDMDEVLKRALDNNVYLINVGTQIDTSKKAVEVAHKYPKGVYATIGLHPVHTEKSYHDPQELGINTTKEEGLALSNAEGFTSRGEVFDYDAYKELSKNEKVVGIGECGLDYYHLNEETKKTQKEAFIKQIELAYDIKKPLMIHCREAFDDLIDILESHKNELLNGYAGVTHFFAGTKDQAKKLLELGFAFSFGGASTFPEKAGKYSYGEIIEYLPMDKIVLETDAPYVTPVPYRGKRNEPVYVIEVAKKIAELKNLTLGETRDMTTQNVLNIFKIKI